MIRKVLVATAIAATLGAAAPSVCAADVFVRVGPPPERVEVVPGPRHGYVWAPGYWNYHGHRHVWVGGHWVRERPGYVYQSPRWVERNGGWYMERERWARHDSDRDGVPNRYDRAPRNPYRS